MDESVISYEARYGWNRQSLRVIGIALAFCAVALLPTMPPWLKIVDIAFFGAGAVLLAAVSLRGAGRPGRLECVGVERRPGLPPLAGKFTGRVSGSAASLESPGIPAEVAASRAATNGWVLDHGRLAAAVAHFAPGVRVVDKTAGQRSGGRQAREQ